MPIVGEAYVTVRAITSGVKKDIESAFTGVDSGAAQSLGKSLGSDFMKGFNDSQNKTGGNLFSSIAAGLEEMDPKAEAAREELSHLVQIAHTMGTAFAGVIGTVSALGGGLVALAGTAAGALPSVAALGNVYGTFGAALGVTKLALHGVGNAISVLSNPTSTAKATTAALAGLTSAQIAFAKFIVSLRPELMSLTALAANALLPELTTGLKTLTSAALPLVSSSITAIATALGKLALGASQAVSSATVLAKLGAVLGTYSGNISVLGKILGNVFGSVLDILVATAPLTATFLNFLDKASTSLKGFLDAKLSDGGLAKFFQQSGLLMSMFGKVFSNIFKGLGAIIGASVGPGSGGDMLLKWLISATNGFANLGKTISGRASLASYFQDVASNSQKILSSVGSLIGALIKLGANKSVGQAFDELKKGEPALADMLQKSASAAPALAKVVVQLIKIGDAFANSKATQDFFQTISSALKVIIGLVSGNGTSSIIAWGAQWTARLSAIGLMLKVLKFGFSGLTGAVISGFKAIGVAVDVTKGLSDTVTALRAAKQAGEGAKEGFELLSSSTSKFGQTVAKIGGGVTSAITGIKDFGVAIKESTAFQKIATAAQWLWDAALAANPIAIIVIAVAALTAGLIWFFTQTKLGKAVFADVMSFIGTAIGDVVKIFQTVVGWIGKNWPLLLAILTGPIGLAVLFITSHWKQISDVFKTVWGNILSFFKTVWGAIVAFFTPAIKAIVKVFQTEVTIIKTVWNATWNTLSTVVKNVVKVVTAIISPFIKIIAKIIQIGVAVIEIIWRLAWLGMSTIFKAVWSGLVKVFTPVINTIKSVITNTVNVIKKTWTTVWTAVGLAFKTTWNSLVSFFSPIIKWIANTTESTVQAVEKTWNTVWTAVGLEFKTTWNSIVSFFSPIIKWIESIIASTVSAVSAVWNTTWNVISSVFRTVWNAIVSFFAGIVHTISGYVSGFVNAFNTVLSFLPKIQSGFNSAFGAIGNFAKGAFNAAIGAVNALLGAVRNTINGIISGVNSIGGLVGVHVAPLGAISIPKLASGGTVFPSSGGTLVNVAEAGQAERIEPLDANGLSERDKQLITALSGPNQPTIEINVPVTTNANPSEIANRVGQVLAFQTRKGAA